MEEDTNWTIMLEKLRIKYPDSDIEVVYGIPKEFYPDGSELHVDGNKVANISAELLWEINNLNVPGIVFKDEMFHAICYEIENYETRQERIKELNENIINDPKSVRDRFYKKYRELHALCPKCGSKSFSQTLLARVLNLNDLDGYVDENEATCSDCGDVHIVHDRLKGKSNNSG